MSLVMSAQAQHKLVEYGIQTEKTDYRLHICFGTETAYLYPTVDGANIVKSGRYKQRIAKQQGTDIVTAVGYAVPWDDIPNIQRIEIPPLVMKYAKVKPSDNTTDKGEWAVKTANILLKRGLFRIEMGSEVIGDKKMQIEGTDLIISASFRIQVKCDWNGGKSSDEKTGTGNLFLQTAECNPFKRH
jgi:hypothetical protein